MPEKFLVSSNSPSCQKRNEILLGRAVLHGAFYSIKKDAPIRRIIRIKTHPNLFLARFLRCQRRKLFYFKITTFQCFNILPEGTPRNGAQYKNFTDFINGRWSIMLISVLNSDNPLRNNIGALPLLSLLLSYFL